MVAVGVDCIDGSAADHTFGVVSPVVGSAQPCVGLLLGLAGGVTSALVDGRSPTLLEDRAVGVFDDDVVLG